MQEYHIKGNGGIGMLTIQHIKDFVAKDHGYLDYKHISNFHATGVISCYSFEDFLEDCMIEYRNQGIEQAAKVCCIHMTDGFSICSESAVLALKEEV